MGLSISGLGTSLDTNAIVAQLMSAERVPQQRLQTQLATIQTRVSAYQRLNTRVTALRSAAQALSTASGWSSWVASSSAPSSVSVTAGPTATPGSLTFSVDHLATAHMLVSGGNAAGTSSVVATGDFLLTQNLASSGFQSLAGTALTVGAHSIDVTQASSAATKAATSAPAVSTTITTGVNDTIEIEINGTPRTLTLSPGSYTAGQLAGAVTAASSGDLSASLDGSGKLVLATTREGSSASLKVTGGTALGDLGLVVDAAALTGTDAVVNVDGTANTLTNLVAGAHVILTSGTGGTIDAVLAGGLDVGDLNATNVAAGDGTLATVVANINAASAGVTAGIIQTAPNAFRLEIASTSTGAASLISVAPGAFTGLGSLTTLTTAADATLTVGSGPAAFSVTSSANTVTNFIPGVTLNLRTADAATPITVSVTRDASSFANKVQTMVNAANALVGEIGNQTDYDTSTNTGSPLTGDFTTRQLGDSLVRAITSAVTTSALGSPGLAGVSVAKDGTFTFDSAKFVAAYNANPTAVEALFRQGGTATSGKVAFLSGTAATTPGSYAVTVTTAAQRAEAQGSVVGGGTLGGAETIDVRSGGTTVSYAAAAGESLDSIAQGLNTVIAQQGFGLLATVESGALVVRSTAYGTAAAFDVRVSAVGAGHTGLATVAGNWESHTGVDVAGTINGVAATGSGQTLRAPSDNSVLGGLALTISATSADVAASTDFGTFTYVPGVAARLDALSRSASDPVSGSLTLAISSKQSEITGYNTRIAAWDIRLALRQTTLKHQFTAMETALASLKSQSDYLTNALAQLGATTTQKSG
jgi:flagellar hook-associated protein 2